MERHYAPTEPYALLLASYRSYRAGSVIFHRADLNLPADPLLAEEHAAFQNYPTGRASHQSSTDSFQSREQQRCPPTRTARMRPRAASTFKRVLLTPALSNGANGEMASTPYSGELKDRRLDQTLLHRSATPQSNFHDG